MQDFLCIQVFFRTFQINVWYLVAAKFSHSANFWLTHQLNQHNYITVLWWTVEPPVDSSPLSIFEGAEEGMRRRKAAGASLCVCYRGTAVLRSASDCN